MKKVILAAVSVAAILGLGACSDLSGGGSASPERSVEKAIEELDEFIDGGCLAANSLVGRKKCVEADTDGDTSGPAPTPPLEPTPAVVNNYFDSPEPAPTPSHPAPSPESEPANVSVTAHTPVKIDGPPTDAKPVPGDENVYYYFKGGRCKLASQGEPSATAKAFHRKGCPDTVS